MKNIWNTLVKYSEYVLAIILKSILPKSELIMLFQQNLLFVLSKTQSLTLR